MTRLEFISKLALLDDKEFLNLVEVFKGGGKSMKEEDPVGVTLDFPTFESFVEYLKDQDRYSDGFDYEAFYNDLNILSPEETGGILGLTPFTFWMMEELANPGQAHMIGSYKLPNHMTYEGENGENWANIDGVWHYTVPLDHYKYSFEDYKKYWDNNEAGSGSVLHYKDKRYVAPAKTSKHLEGGTFSIDHSKYGYSKKIRSKYFDNLNKVILHLANFRFNDGTALNDYLIAGILGNMADESAGNDLVISPNGKWSGLFLNTTDKRKYIIKNYGGYSIDSLLKYLDDWLNSTRWSLGGFASGKKNGKIYRDYPSDSINDGSDGFQYVYENNNWGHREERRGYATEFYRMLQDARNNNFSLEQWELKPEKMNLTLDTEFKNPEKVVPLQINYSKRGSVLKMLLGDLVPLREEDVINDSNRYYWDRYLVLYTDHKDNFRNTLLYQDIANSDVLKRYFEDVLRNNHLTEKERNKHLKMYDKIVAKGLDVPYALYDYMSKLNWVIGNGRDRFAENYNNKLSLIDKYSKPLFDEYLKSDEAKNAVLRDFTNTEQYKSMLNWESLLTPFLNDFATIYNKERPDKQVTSDLLLDIIRKNGIFYHDFGDSNARGMIYENDALRKGIYLNHYKIANLSDFMNVLSHEASHLLRRELLGNSYNGSSSELNKVGLAMLGVSDNMIDAIKYGNPRGSNDQTMKGFDAEMYALNSLIREKIKQTLGRDVDISDPSLVSAEDIRNAIKSTKTGYFGDHQWTDDEIEKLRISLCEVASNLMDNDDNNDQYMARSGMKFITLHKSGGSILDLLKELLGDSEIFDLLENFGIDDIMKGGLKNTKNMSISITIDSSDDEKLTNTLIVEVGNKTYEVEVVSSDEDMEKGLGERKSLDSNKGMLFDFKKVRDQVVFNMEEMLFNIDIIFINDDDEVIKVAVDCEPGEDLFVCKNVRYVLEVNANSGIKKGDDFDLVDEKESVPTMKVLAPDGSVLMELEGGERIFSRKNTKTLIKMAKRAEESLSDSDFKRLGNKMFKFIHTLDTNKPEYVEVPEN